MKAIWFVYVTGIICLTCALVIAWSFVRIADKITDIRDDFNRFVTAVDPSPMTTSVILEEGPLLYNRDRWEGHYYRPPEQFKKPDPDESI